MSLARQRWDNCITNTVRASRSSGVRKSFGDRSREGDRLPAEPERRLLERERLLRERERRRERDLKFEC
jgi:hypothetical protein